MALEDDCKRDEKKAEKFRNAGLFAMAVEVEKRTAGKRNVIYKLTNDLK